VFNFESSPSVCAESLKGLIEQVLWKKFSLKPNQKNCRLDTYCASPRLSASARTCSDGALVTVSHWTVLPMGD
jgi:hypothetical protein